MASKIIHNIIQNVITRAQLDGTKVRLKTRNILQMHIVFSLVFSMLTNSTNIIKNGNFIPYHSRPKNKEAGITVDSFHSAKHSIITTVNSSNSK